MNYQILIYDVKTIVRNVISQNVQTNRKLLPTICVLFKTSLCVSKCCEQMCLYPHIRKVQFCQMLRALNSH